MGVGGRRRLRMNHISIGDTTGMTILVGLFPPTTCRTATPFFKFSPDPEVQEHIQLELSGTSSQIAAFIASLELIAQRSIDHETGHYPHPQYLRFQPESGGLFYNAILKNIYLSSNPAGYKTRPSGSLLVNLHYTRPNYFDGDQVELPLSGASGTNVTGGFDIKYHTDQHPADGNTALIKPADFATDLPAPLRIELKNNYAGATIKDIFMGAYHHPTNQDDDVFFYNAGDLAGGTLMYDATAIGGAFRRYTWTSSSYTIGPFFSVILTDSNLLDGRTYRPLMNLFKTHAYTDLYFMFQIRRGVDVIYSSEPVYSDPDFDYVLFPPVDLPPNQLLRENVPHGFDFVVQALRVSGAATTIDIDMVQFFPMDYAALFKGFYLQAANDILIYDNHRQRHNVRYSLAQNEILSHILEGGPLMLYPGSYTRLFFNMFASNNHVYCDRTAQVRAYYRPRKRLL